MTLTKQEQEELYQKALGYLTYYQDTDSTLTISSLQRRLRTGYTIAAKILDRMEEEGYISSSSPGLQRKVIKVKTVENLTVREFMLNEINNHLDSLFGSDSKYNPTREDHWLKFLYDNFPKKDSELFIIEYSHEPCPEENEEYDSRVYTHREFAEEVILNEGYEVKENASGGIFYEKQPETPMDNIKYARIHKFFFGK